jgi:hypothetical protein
MNQPTIPTCQYLIESLSKHRMEIWILRGRMCQVWRKEDGAQMVVGHLVLSLGCLRNKRIANLCFLCLVTSHLQNITLLLQQLQQVLGPLPVRGPQMDMAGKADRLTQDHSGIFMARINITRMAERHLRQALSHLRLIRPCYDRIAQIRTGRIGLPPP